MEVIEPGQDRKIAALTWIKCLCASFFFIKKGSVVLNERRYIFSKLYYFTLNCNIKYKAFVFRKSEFDDVFKLEARMARELSRFIRDNLGYFQEFERVILYYDNGQHELNRIFLRLLSWQLRFQEH